MKAWCSLSRRIAIRRAGIASSSLLMLQRQQCRRSFSTTLPWREDAGKKAAQHGSTSTPPVSAVNVEEFTLNEEVVARDVSCLEQWNALAGELETAKSENRSKDVLSIVQKGLQLLETLGADNAPVLCEPHLCMEAAQAHLQLHEFPEALSILEKAEKRLAEAPKASRDVATISECQLLRANALLVAGKGAEAEAVLRGVKDWIEGDAKTASPLQAVAASHLHRSVLTALGQSLVMQGISIESSGADQELKAKERFGKALDILIEALNKHLDETEVEKESVKATLAAIARCFEGVKDFNQALTTFDKYCSWCSRHEDPEGEKQGKAMREALCARHNIKQK